MARSEKMPRGGVIALGFFDGVHLGHRYIIDSARREAEVRGAEVGVWMISTDSDGYKSGAPIITDEREKLSLLHAAGARWAAVYAFSELRDLNGESFVGDILKDALGASCVVCGFNFRFGKGAAWGVEELRAICERYGIDVISADGVTDASGECISSTRIRSLIASGEVESAALMLGRPYSFTSTVLSGKRLGRRLGFPTVNQVPEDGRLMPPPGVYAVCVEFTRDGVSDSYAGAANVGFCPTVSEAAVDAECLRNAGAARKGHAVCETYIADFAGDLYGADVTVRFLRRLRGETKFDSIGELTRQIGLDARESVRIYNEIYGKKK